MELHKLVISGNVKYEGEGGCMNKIKTTLVFIIFIIVVVPYFFSWIINGQVNIEDSQLVNVIIDGTSVELSQNEYIIGVLANEIPTDYPLEAMKAQAIMVRTRLYRDISNGGESAYGYLGIDDIVEKWKGEDIQRSYGELESAVYGTSDIVMTFGGELVIAPYHTINNGTTVSGEDGFGTDDYPYLVSVECGLDIVEGVESEEHGMGLSQNTARYMALEGMDYQAILKYFFKDIELTE